MKKSTSFSINNCAEFKIQMLNWASQFNIFCLLDNQQYQFAYNEFECLLAVGCKKSVQASVGNVFTTLQQFVETEKDWLFGHFNYDVKNEIETLQSNNLDGVGFDDMNFFIPEIVVKLSQSVVTFFCEESAADVFNLITNQPSTNKKNEQHSVEIKNRIGKEDYINTIHKIQQHILRGDCYELNFCQEFFADNATINPTEIYINLISISPNPFSVLYKLNDKYCIGASPERYIKKKGNQLISQPIKGTAKRNISNKSIDDANKEFLKNSEKEKSENVMIVDLVRNDFSKICKEGSVKIDELFGIYSFPQVHQMISTICGEAADNVNWVDIIKATFPMGSMTGAPKKKAMELIEQYEQTKRGLFSGTIGYVTPDGDFDFNVVIRSLFYNANKKHLSFQTGSAITFYSDAENEYEECLLKAEAIKMALQKNKQ